MTGVPSGSAPTATAATQPVWPLSGSPTGAPSASRHTCTVPSAAAAAADDDRGAVRQRPDRHRVTPRRRAGQDLAGGPATVGPAGLPGPVGGGARDAGGQAAAAELVGGQFELAGPRRPVEGGEVVGALPVHGGGGARRGGSCGVQVGHQPGRIDAEQVVRILQELIEPVCGGGVLGHVFAQVAVLPARAPGLAEEHVEQHAFVAGLVPCGEQLVGEGLVEQAGHRPGAALGRGRLEQVVGGPGTAQGIQISDHGAVAEGGGEGEPGRVVQPGAPRVAERREQPAVALPPMVGQPVQVLLQRLPDPGRNVGRIEPRGGRVHGAGGGQRDGGHRGDQEVPPGPLRDHGGQPVTHRMPGTVLRPGGAGRAGAVHSVLGEQGGGEPAQAIEVEVGAAVQVDEIVVIAGGDAEGGEQPARRIGVADGQRPGGDGDPQPGQHRQLSQRLVICRRSWSLAASSNASRTTRMGGWAGRSARPVTSSSAEAGCPCRSGRPGR